MSEALTERVNALLEGIGLTTRLRTVNDVLYVCSRTSIFVAFMEALLGLPVDNAIRETETVSDVAHNIRCVLDQLGGALGVPLTHISPEKIVDKESIPDIEHLVDIFHGYLTLRRSSRPKPRLDLSHSRSAWSSRPSEVSSEGPPTPQGASSLADASAIRTSMRTSVTRASGSAVSGRLSSEGRNTRGRRGALDILRSSESQGGSARQEGRPAQGPPAGVTGAVAAARSVEFLREGGFSLSPASAAAASRLRDALRCAEGSPTESELGSDGVATDIDGASERSQAMRGASRPKTPGDDSMRASDGDHVLRGSLGVVETDRSKVEESEVEEPVNETTTMTDEGRAGTSDLGRSMGEDLVREGAAGTRADEGVERSLQGGAGRGSRAERSTEHSGLDDSLDESGHAILSLDRSMENVSPGSSVGRMEGATDLERSTESRGVRDGDDDAAKSPSTRSASHMSTPTDRGSQAPSEDRSVRHRGHKDTARAKRPPAKGSSAPHPTPVWRPGLSGPRWVPPAGLYNAGGYAPESPRTERAREEQPGADRVRETPTKKGSGWREKPMRLGRAEWLLKEVRRKYEEAIGAPLSAKFHNDSPAMVTAAERTHSAPRQAFDPEARGGRAKSAAAAVAAAVADDLEMAARLLGLERMRRTHGAEARARREAAAAAKEAARLRAMKWRLGKMLSARDRRQRHLEARQQVLALRRERHAKLAAGAKEEAELKERRNRSLGLKERLAGEQARELSGMLLEAIHAEKEVLIVERAKRSARARSAEVRQGDRRESQRKLMGALLDALTQRMGQMDREIEDSRRESLRMVERAERERRAAAVDAMRTEGTWARSRVEFKHYVDRAAEKAAVARALSHVLAA